MSMQLCHTRQRMSEAGQYDKYLSSEPIRKSVISTFYQQSCPTCGRRLLIKTKHLGSNVSCSHCRCTFVARDTSQDQTAHEIQPSIMERAERLLALLRT